MLNEPSSFGDAVKAGVKHEKEFFDGWNNVAGRFDTVSDEEKPAVVLKMETDLYALYLRVLHNEKESPASIHETLESQAGKLEPGFQK